MKDMTRQFARMANGERVLIEMLGEETEMPAQAIVRRIEGERAGTRATCFVSTLTLLGHEIPKTDSAISESS